jgi:uncharacterized protein (TIGR02453 family)
MLQEATLKFLKGLKKNNNKPWFDAHKAQYELAKNDFEQFIQQLIDAHAKKDKDLAGLTGKKCVFRIYRDVRFSKNKTPYKNNFAASMDRGGRKSGFAGYYFHLEPGQSFIGAGIWQPEPPALKNIRQEIDYNYKEFRSIVQKPVFKKIYGDLYTGEDVQLKKIPQGFEKDNPAAEYLRFKSWMALADLTDKELTSASLVKKSLEAMNAAIPFIHFINHALAEQE